MTEAQIVNAHQVNVFDVVFEQVKFGDVTQWRELGTVSGVSGYSNPKPDDAVKITVRVSGGFKTHVYRSDSQLAVIKGEKWAL